jgi:hypothetical protein
VGIIVTASLPPPPPPIPSIRDTINVLVLKEYNRPTTLLIDHSSPIQVILIPLQSRVKTELSEESSEYEEFYVCVLLLVG